MMKYPAVIIPSPLGAPHTTRNNSYDNLVSGKALEIANIVLVVLCLVALLFALVNVSLLSLSRWKRKHATSAQRTLFIFVGLNIAVRLISHICIAVESVVFDEKGVTSPMWFQDMLWALDIMGSLFDFASYLVLVTFWAEQYYAFTSGYWNRLEKKTARMILGVRWLLTITVFLVVFLFMIIAVAITYNASVSYVTKGNVMEYGRLFIRLLLSLFITTSLLVYGTKLYKELRYRRKEKKLLQVGCITAFCSISFLLLSALDLCNSFIWGRYGAGNLLSSEQIRRIMFCVLSLSELSANFLLLVVLRPRAQRSKMVSLDFEQASSSSFISSSRAPPAIGGGIVGPQDWMRLENQDTGDPYDDDDEEEEEDGVGARPRHLMNNHAQQHQHQHQHHVLNGAPVVAPVISPIIKKSRSQQQPQHLYQPQQYYYQQQPPHQYNNINVRYGSSNSSNLYDDAAHGSSCDEEEEEVRAIKASLRRATQSSIQAAAAPATANNNNNNLNHNHNNDERESPPPPPPPQQNQQDQQHLL